MIKQAWTLLVAVAVVGCSGSNNVGGTGSGSAPPVAPTTPSTVTNSPPMMAPSACRADQLTAQAFFVPAGAGNDEYRIRISDTGAPCSLRGRPSSLYGVDTAGHQTRLRPTPLSADNTTAMTTGRPARLTATKAGEVVLVTTTGCPGAQHSPSPNETFASLRLGIGPRTIAVAFRGGPERGDTTIWLPCGVTMSNFYAAA